MLEVLTDRSEVQEAQQQLEQALQDFWNEKIDGYVSYKGERYRTTLSWSDELSIWAMLGKKESNHYWNAFGLKKPRKNSSNHIVLQIDFPLEGIDRRVGGVFVKDGEAHIFVCHRGRIGGGRPGIGKTLFESNFCSDRWIAVRDGGKETEVVLIDELASPRLAFQICNFIAKIDRIKKLATRNTENLAP